MDLTDLNSAAPDEARLHFGECCGSHAWVDRMVTGRPYADTTRLLVAAEEAWWDLGVDEWEEAIGDGAGSMMALQEAALDQARAINMALRALLDLD